MDNGLNLGDEPMDNITVRLPRSLRERVQQHGQKANKAVTTLIREWIAERASELDNRHAGPPETGAGAGSGTTDPAIDQAVRNALHDLQAALQISAAETTTTLRNLDIRLREKAWEDMGTFILAIWLVQHANGVWVERTEADVKTWIAEERSRRHAEQEERIEKAIQAAGA